MKKLTTISSYMVLCVCVLVPSLLSAQSRYARYYENLPIEVKQVEEVTFPETRTNIAKYGAVPNTGELCTAAIQQAIDELAAQGGGHVIVPRGVWKTGPIVLQSNIDLHLNRGAVLLFTEDKTQYIIPDKKGKAKTKADPCIKASKVENVGITGQGVIDGQGFFWRPLKHKKLLKGSAEDKAVWDEALALGGVVRDEIWYPWNLNNGIPNIGSNPEDQESYRYHLVNITDSRNVLIEGVTLRNSPKFHLVPARIQNLIIDNVTIDCPWWAQNGDAMDIGNTQTCLVVNCKVSAGDDGICMKGGVGQSGFERGPNSDFVIRYDTVFRAHGGFVIGSEFSGGMEKMVVKDCYFDGTDIGLRFKSAPGRGGHCKDIYCEDIVMRNIREDAVFFESGYADKAVGRSATAGDDKEAFFPDWANFTFRNITCVNPRTAVNATGLKGFPVHDLVFENVRFIGVLREAFMLKHAENFTFRGVTVSGATDNVIDKKSCKNIIFNGKDLAQ